MIISGAAAVIVTVAGFATGLMRIALRPTLIHYVSVVTYSRIPIALALGAAVLLVLRGENEAKPIWPINILDLMYAALFFFYGFGLWKRQDLIKMLTRTSSMILLWTSSAIAYLVHLILSGISDSLKSTGNVDQLELLSFLDSSFYGFSAALLSLALLGTFEVIMAGSNSRWQRWLADSSYLSLIHI